MKKILTVKQWLEEKNKKQLELVLVGVLQQAANNHIGRIYPDNLFLKQTDKLKLY